MPLIRHAPVLLVANLPLLFLNGQSVAGWKVGDSVEAVYDGDYYPATIASLDADAGTCTVAFAGYDGESTVTVASLRAASDKQGQKRAATDVKVGAVTQRDKTGAEKEAEREYKRARREKKAKRLEMKEEAATKQANAWQKFNKGTSSKSKTGFRKGKSRESIFKTPDSIDGRVGIGTNNIGGRGMTESAKKQNWGDLRKGEL